MIPPYPERSRERDHWILARRPARLESASSPSPELRPAGFLAEEEPAESGGVISVATIFLTNRECPWRCLMCDLWRHTLTRTVPSGAIPAQIDYALERMSPARQIKLYNSGSFFDHRAIPPDDYPAIAARLQQFERVIVESHPALVNDDCARFRDLLAGRLEVAMGLETVHPEVLPRLNKRLTLDQFSRAAARLCAEGVALRTFILVKPPFLDESAALEWAARSLDFAFDCGAGVAALIPTRFGNGALEALAERGEFAPPRLETLEAAMAYGLELGRGRVLADLWDLERPAGPVCLACRPARVARLGAMNLQQTVLPSILCESCESDPGD
ncbi:MAG TPA: radical SAM protein [Blastocatellia bacterium]|nr:radical SAM protein [Blastocatellia bacterium]